MSRRNKEELDDSIIQLELDFDKVLESTQALSRDDLIPYDPVQKTAEYMNQLVESQRQWETTIRKARECLMNEDPRELYSEFFRDLKVQIESNSTKAERLSKLLEHVAIRGLGMGRKEVNIHKPPRGSSRWRVELNNERIEKHLSTHVIGKYFLNPIESDDSLWNHGNFLIGSSDVSQHRGAVPTPARFFNRTVPFLLNNAAGAIVRVEKGVAEFEQGRFDPPSSQELLQWMLIDPSYQDELDPEDFLRCSASAMDVGQYLFDSQHLLNADKTAPDIVLRDGSLFPQDAYLDNFIIDSRRGEFTRKAIRELLSCLNSAQDFNRIYCGVAKNVRLKVYSAIVDWYIARKKSIDQTWDISSYTLTDGQAMTLLLSSPDFQQDGFKNVYSTCLIRRSFTTRATLNQKADLENLEAHFEKYQEKIAIDGTGIEIKPYISLCDVLHTYIFFLSHSPQPSRLLPRYEFLSLKDTSPEEIVSKIWTAIRYCGFTVDTDHSFVEEDPISYMIPSVTQQAHNYSKDVGKWITGETKRKLWARYTKLINSML